MKRRKFLETAFLSPLICMAHKKNGDLNQSNPLLDYVAKTKIEPLCERRVSFAKLLQNECDKVSAEDFFAYKEANDKLPQYQALEFLDKSFENTLKEIKSISALPEEILIWHIYNIGYVFKTQKATFAIDICHKNAEKLADTLDFLLITHNHRDHFDKKLIAAMGKKPVISNFIENKFKMPNGGNFERKGISITATPVDHNTKLKKFVLAFEISCNSNNGNCTIYHIGDACNHRQLKPSQTPDIFIAHLAVGLDIKKTQTENVKPKFILVSHILELGHSIDKWRWPISVGNETCNKCKIAKAYLPLWGDKIIWNKQKKLVF